MGTTVEVGFVLNDGSQPLFRLNDSVRGVLDNATYLLGGVSYVDITEYVNNISFKRGKNRELDRFSAGTLTVQLNNEDRTFDPSYSGSPFYGNIIPRREIRILVDSIPQFSGVIEDWNFDYDVSGKSKAVIVAADAFTLLAQQSLTAGTATVQTSGARVAAVLDMASIEWPAANRNIDAGLSILGADVFSGNALQYLQDVEVSEQGALFIGKDGFINFQDRGVTPTSANYLETVRTNLVTNPSMESVTSGTVVMRRNLVTNPSFEVDTAGWGGGAGVTISRDTATFYSGAASMKVVTDGMESLQGSGILCSPAGLVPGVSRFSVSAWVKAPAGASMRIECASIGTGGGYVLNTFTGTGSWQFVKAENALVGSDYIYPIIRTHTAQAITFYVDSVMLEASSTVGDYFDGSTTDALGWDYAWSGTANASISTAACAATTVRTNLMTNPSFETGTTPWSAISATISRVTTQAYVGTASLEVVTGGTSTGVGSGYYAATASTAYTLSAWVKGEAGKSVRFDVYEQPDGLTLSGADVVMTGSWQRLSITKTTKSNTTNIGFTVTNRTAGAHTFYLDAVLLEVSSTAGDYFDGSFNPAGDFSYAWTGTANASTSIQRGATITSLSGINGTGIASNTYKYLGTQSIRAIPTTNTGGIQTTTITTTIGSTYTASAWVYTTAIKSLQMTATNPATTGATVSVPANTWTRLSVTFTATNTSTVISVLGTASTQTFYVDAVLLETSPIVQDYFDGSTNSAFYINTWTGTENNSTSIQQKFIYSFSDNGTDIPYINVGINYGTELLFNQAIISSSAGTAISDNVTSENTYGITQYSASTLVSTTSQLQNISDYVVAKYGVPELRFEIIEVILDDLTPEQRANVLNLELGDIAIIAFTPNGIGSEIVQICQIISIAHNVQVASHKISFGMSWLQFSFLVMDDVEFGRLDSTYVLAF